MAGARLDGWTAFFLLTTILTSATGFFFPADKVTPAHAVGAISLVVLVVQLFVKTPPLAQLAPTQAEPPFAVTQGLVLLVFLVLGWAALRGFRKAP